MHSGLRPCWTSGSPCKDRRKTSPQVKACLRLAVASFCELYNLKSNVLGGCGRKIRIPMLGDKKKHFLLWRFLHVWEPSGGLSLRSTIWHSGSQKSSFAKYSVMARGGPFAHRWLRTIWISYNSWNKLLVVANRSVPLMAPLKVMDLESWSTTWKFLGPS